MQLATLTQSPEFALSDVEAKTLAASAAKVAEFYPAPSLSPKTAAWLALGQTALMVYGPKLFAVRKRRRNAKATAAQRAQADADAAAAGFGFVSEAQAH